MCMHRQNKDDDATSLDYRHSNLNDVPSDVFTHERTLEELRLDSNHIRDLPRVCYAWFLVEVILLHIVSFVSYLLTSSILFTVIF